MYLEPLAIDRIETVAVGTTAVTVRTDGQPCLLQNSDALNVVYVQVNGIVPTSGNSYALGAGDKTGVFIAQNIGLLSANTDKTVTIVYFK